MSKENQKRNDDKLEAHELSFSNSKQQKLEAGEIVVPKGKFALWWENYWYHYKFHTIVVLFAIFVCTVCFVQCSQKESGDLTVIFAGACGFENAEDRDNLIEVLNAVAPKSEQKDEKLSVLLTTYSIFSEEELRALDYYMARLAPYCDRLRAELPKRQRLSWLLPLALSAALVLLLL